MFFKGDDLLGGGQDVSIMSLMARAFELLDKKQVDLSETIAVLSLFTLMDIVNLAREKGSGGLGTAGGKDLLAMLSGMLSSGQKMGPEMLAAKVQKSGKSVSPQLLSTLLSLLGESTKGESAGEESSRQKPVSSERRLGRELSRYPEK
ncbi:MAG: hypothetical protein WAP24_04010 [Thermacetogeniaceae bacterium]|jgi:hypothetical protein